MHDDVDGQRATAQSRLGVKKFIFDRLFLFEIAGEPIENQAVRPDTAGIYILGGV